MSSGVSKLYSILEAEKCFGFRLDFWVTLYKKVFYEEVPQVVLASPFIFFRKSLFFFTSPFIFFTSPFIFFPSPFCFCHEALLFFSRAPLYFFLKTLYFFTSPFIFFHEPLYCQRCQSVPSQAWVPRTEYQQRTNNERNHRKLFFSRCFFEQKFWWRCWYDVGDADGAIEDHFQQNWFVSPRRAQECIHCFKAHHSTDGDNQIKLFKKPTTSMVPDQWHC